MLEEAGATCCYARSEKQWVSDPQGVPWETFLTHGESTAYGNGGALGRLAAVGETAAAPVCCAPAAEASSAPHPARAPAAVRATIAVAVARPGRFTVSPPRSG